MTWLYFVNYFFFQWFFIRLARAEEKIISDVKVWFEGSDDIIKNLIKVKTQAKETTYQWYSIMGFVWPLSGWNTPYKFIGKTFYKRLTKKKLKCYL